MKRPIRFLLRAFPIVVLTVCLLGVIFLTVIRIEGTVEAQGEVLAERYQVIRPQVSGLVQELLVEPGEAVEAGQILARLADGDFERELLQAERTLIQTQAQLEQRRAELDLLTRQIHPVEREQQEFKLWINPLDEELSAAYILEAELEQRAATERYERAKKLSDLGLFSEQELAEALQDKLLAEQRVARSRLEDSLARQRVIELETANRLLTAQQERQRVELGLRIRELEALAGEQRRELERLNHQGALLTVAAGMDGIVLSPPLNDLLGRRVQAGEELLTLVDVSSIFFEIGVPEQAIVRVRTGQKAFVEVTGLPKRQFRPFDGRVERVAHHAATAAADREPLYPVQIGLDEPWVDLGESRFFLRQGMRGVAHISYRQNLRIVTAFYEFLIGRPGLPEPTKTAL